MDTTATLQKGRLVRPLALIVALASLALAASAIAQPAFAGDSYQVPLHEAHQGADSSTFSPDNDCGDYTTGVVWHFILNQYSGDAAELHAQFEGAGWLTTVSTKVLQNTQGVGMGR